MENQENKSNWDDLARELGADPPPAAESPVSAPTDVAPAAADPAKSAPSKPSPVRPPARPKTTTKDWDDLATNLGIEPPATEPTTARSMENKDMEDSEHASESAPHLEAPEARDEPRVSTEQAVADHQQPSSAIASEPPPPPAGGVSVWHKIFGSPEQQAERIVESRQSTETTRGDDDERQSEDRPSRRGKRSPDPGPEREAKRADDVVSRSESSAELAPDATDADQAADALEEGEPKKRRPRRRRRGRERKQDGEATADGDSASRDEPKPSRRSGGQSTTRPHDVVESEIEFDDEIDDEFDDAEVGQDEDQVSGTNSDQPGAKQPAARATSPRHRNIPTWDEAIGLIVDANLQSRPERRRSSPQKSARSGSARGRPRGRRKKKS